jgi:hypothetical protein
MHCVGYCRPSRAPEQPSTPISGQAVPMPMPGGQWQTDQVCMHPEFWRPALRTDKSTNLMNVPVLALTMAGQASETCNSTGCCCYCCYCCYCGGASSHEGPAVDLKHLRVTDMTITSVTKCSQQMMDHCMGTCMAWTTSPKSKRPVASEHLHSVASPHRCQEHCWHPTCVHRMSN